jgi:hypothetical protein
VFQNLSDLFCQQKKFQNKFSFTTKNEIEPKEEYSIAFVTINFLIENSHEISKFYFQVEISKSFERLELERWLDRLPLSKTKL